MKHYHLIIFYFLFGISTINFGQSKLDAKIDFKVENLTISKTLLKLGKAANIDIAFSENYFKQSQTISLNLENQSIESILNKILQETSIQFKYRDSQIILIKKAPPKFTISGYISDAETGERLISATVFCPDLSIGTLTNEYGFFSLTLPRGEHKLNWSYLGFSEKETTISLQKNQRLAIDLNPSIILAEVVVRPDSNRISASFPATEGDKILTNQLKIIPDIGGEADLIRAMQLLPGVSSGADGFGGLSVRGGSNDQNLVMLDGVPLYNATHLMGQFSIFNANAIRSVKLLKGGFPARYGGRSSSILDVRTREGNRRHWTAEAGLGMLAANASVEGPFANGKGAFFLAGRQTHSDFFLEPLIEKVFFDEATDDIDYHFIDLNGKVNFDLGKNDRLLLSFYQGGDEFSGQIEEDSLEFDLETKSLLDWENSLFSLRWNHIFNNKIFSNTTFTTSRFSSQYRFYVIADVEEELEDEIPDQLVFQDFSSDIKDWTIKTDWDFLPNPKHHLKFGLGYTNHSILPIFEAFDESQFESPDSIDFDNYEVEDAEIFDAQSFHAYLEDDFDLNTRIRLNAGLRFSYFNSEEESFANLEPRLALQYSLTEKIKLSTSITRMVQHLHLLINDDLRVFSNIWFPSTEGLKPQSAWQGTLGSQFLGTNFSLGIEGYLKRVSNVYQDEFFVEDTDDFPHPSTSLNYGIEFFIRKNHGNTGGWINYTLSKSELETPIFVNNEMVGMKKSPFQFDARHQLKLFLYQKLGTKWAATLNWVYSSPLPSTIFFNESQFSFEEDPPPPIIDSERGSPNHRLDLGISYFLKRPKTEHNFKFSIYNLYNRANPAFYIVDFEFDINSGNLESTEPRPVSLMPILPSLYYGIKF